ncbi:MAG: SagB/ThcOx family dehydrogenase [Bacteroidales bacterium]|nr:SagB/ThcOx family dehydrogenase [Bacteroidales bacterium]
MKKLFILMIMASGISITAQNIVLPEPQKTGGKPLMEALNERHSSRTFSEREPDLQTLSDLLWAGFGYNRPEERKRTAPTSRNYQEIEIYVSIASGLYVYDAWENTLVQIHNRDIRANTGSQDYVGKAPLNLVYVANQQKVQNPHSERQLLASHTNAGFIAQNVYLYCASEGLVAVVRALFDSEILKKEMALDENMIIILTQTVGYPQKEN